MATLELTFTPGYVEWGLWESIREIAQNAADAHDQGKTMTIRYSHKKGVKIGGKRLEGVLEFRNIGARLSKENLLLGGTDKRDDANMRGQFGEGMKLAWACLLRMGKRVWIRTGDERWVPELSWSKVFESDLLKIKTAKTKDNDDVFVQVQGVALEDWKIIQERLLFLTPPDAEQVVETSDGRILMEEKYKGSLYVKGIYVCHLPDRYHYGYDLFDVKLDRDRKLADPWSLKTAIREVIMSAVKYDKIPAEEILEVLDDQGCGEAKVFDSEQYYTGNEFHEKVAAAFVEAHGENAAPVTAMGDSIEAKHHGLNGVMVTEPLKKVIERNKGSFDSRKVSRATEAEHRYVAEELEEDEMLNLMISIDLISEAMKLEEMGDASLDIVQVVDFVGEKVIGTYQVTDGTEQIRVARKVLKDPGKLVTVLVHEFTHGFGYDGSIEHRDAQDRVYGRIIAKRVFEGD